MYDSFYDEEFGYYVTIVERLIPLDPNVANLLFARYSRPNSYNWQIIKRLLPREEFETIVKDYFKKNYKYNPLFWVPEITDEFYNSNNSNDFYNKLIIIIQNKITEGKKISIILSEVRKLAAGIVDKLTMDFPSHYGEYEIEGYHRTDVKFFLDFLLRLKNEFGIAWNDIKRDNIMQRPTTREIVLSDPGLFDFQWS